MKKLIFIFLMPLLFSSCGRKQKDVFLFPQEVRSAKRVNKLSLPSVRGVSVVKTLRGNMVSWQTVSLSNQNEKEFIGYNVYRLVESFFVPKKTLNKFWITKTEFLDALVLEKDFLNNEKSDCYLVRAVFQFDDQIIEGPSSIVVCVK